MKKIERILAIIVLLLDNDRVTTVQLAERFSVTKRTIFRDIETIELAGFPIIAQPGRNGGFSLLNSFKLRTYTYSHEEKQDILTALTIKEGLFGTTDGQNMIKEKITLLQEQERSKKNLSFESPTVHRAEIEIETKLKINQINLALKEHHKLAIDYIGNSGELTQRVIHPYELMLMNGSWYLYSYCENRNDFRYFKMTRMRQIKILSTSFNTQPYSTSKELSTANQEIIELRFRKNDLGRLYDYYTDKEMNIKETHVDVTIYANQQQTILSFLLMFGNGVQVLSPTSLKERHKAAIKKLNETY